MNTGRYDCIVVGGGVAGLMTAARLSGHGMSVALVEAALLGSGSTTRNHGMLHSGALYARWHPEVVGACLQAQTAYRSSFPRLLADTETCWYLGTPATMYTYDTLWRHYDLAHCAVDPREINEVLAVPDSSTVVAIAVQELLIDTHGLISELAARCVANGVEVLVGTRVLRVVTRDGVVRGVETAAGVIEAANVVVCTGIGTREVLERSGSVVAQELSSRLEMMMAFPGHLPCVIIGLEFGWPALAPSAAGGAVLASRYGAPQRFVCGPARWPVPARDAADLVGELDTWLQPGLIDTTGGVGWVCSKTEHLRGSSDQWGTEPNFALIDHRDSDGVTGWWTVLPGKMTLALHASRATAAAVTGTQPRLALRPHAGATLGGIADLVDVSPWTAHTEASTR
ncbi:NAD(P)/FAD-dependent oxidoreductase [Nocardia abscessus]|uniref:NAD(P)/FAD-dependent oxidoreductase n=1 Tax=Nocardia abscessus TaxID=120957 RepID=UPI00245704F9|nr:FAD-dependent oxidoreductase [Nocardia abscessus]